MMQQIFISDKIQRPSGEVRDMLLFIQRMVNRLTVGFVRYGAAKKEQCYMTRLIMETKAYKRTGNAEYLYNIANYAFLESIAPENKKFHFDETVESATRGKMGVQ